MPTFTSGRGLSRDDDDFTMNDYNNKVKEKRGPASNDIVRDAVEGKKKRIKMFLAKQS